MGDRSAGLGQIHMGERVKIKVKKVERIEATRPHVDPDPPQGSV